MKKRHYIIFIFLLNFFVGYSQKMNLQKFSVKEGLIQSTVKQIEQDDYGNLWLATNYGLSKFNGKIFDSGDGNLEEAQQLVGRSYEMESFALENASGELYVFGSEVMKNSIFVVKKVD